MQSRGLSGGQLPAQSFKHRVTDRQMESTIDASATTELQNVYNRKNLVGAVDDAAIAEAHEARKLGEQERKANLQVRQTIPPPPPHTPAFIHPHAFKNENAIMHTLAGELSCRYQ
jgi:hypothetical protein